MGVLVGVTGFVLSIEVLFTLLFIDSNLNVLLVMASVLILLVCSLFALLIELIEQPQTDKAELIICRKQLVLMSL